MRKPKVITRCIANHYTGPNERIIEFSGGDKGGLISFRLRPEDGTLVVSVYNVDAGVNVIVQGTTHSFTGDPK